MANSPRVDDWFDARSKPYKPPYAFSVTNGENRTRQMLTSVDLDEMLKRPVGDLMRQAKGHAYV